jgi:hypothetical protein
MNKFNYKEQLMRLIKKDSWEKMLVIVVMILMFMYKQEQVRIFVVKNPHLLNLLKANLAVPDLSLHFQLMQVFMDVQPLSLMLKLFQFVQQYYVVAGLGSSLLEDQRTLAQNYFVLAVMLTIQLQSRRK